jgi:hypothetical protein
MDILGAFMNTTPKTAGAQQAPTSTKIAEAVDAASAAVQQAQTKTASVASGAIESGLDKIAGEVAGQELNVSLKQADQLGRAMADGFVSQIGMYEKVAADMAAKQSEKIAGQVVPGGTSEILDPETVRLVKMAQERPQEFLAEVEKRAAEQRALEDQHAATLEQDIHKTASAHYQEGYRAMTDLLKAS